MPQYFYPLEKHLMHFSANEGVLIRDKSDAEFADYHTPKNNGRAATALALKGTWSVYFPKDGSFSSLGTAVLQRATVYMRHLCKKKEIPNSDDLDRHLFPETSNETLSILSDLVAWSKYSEAANIQDIIARAAKVLEANAAKQDGL